MKQLKNQRGLTLIELLAVIVILAIIAAIAAVAIGNVINNSKDKAILSDAVTIIDGAKIAVMDDVEGDKTQGATGNDTITYTGKDKSVLKPYIELSEDKWKDFEKLEIKGMSDGETEYILTYNKFSDIKNKKYKPNGEQKTANLEQILKALDGKGDQATSTTP